ncbi:MAG: peptidoglycan DD-metalloendopeptidase family protein [Intrasporangium sp.]|uniref:peptidoglycan DD-metalloendopeptidase family protein n=1 Tax=Intrasporangium sp. TaxID=1925024 RepID=UPI0026483C21|nr:peptidoglycan DD-metalloendopeptidase family protein [Intrasporangium sp.]MDN5795219.1 peptidoglycan DD-metalloendopeptidase family protein [Intrasporangium sp.]
MWPKLCGSRTGTRLTAVGVALACSMSLGPSVARADDVKDQKRQADKRIAALGQQLEGTNANLATAYVNLEKTKAALPGARQRLANAQATVSRAEAAQAQAEDTERRALAAEAEARAHNEQVAQKLAVAKASEVRAKEQLSKTQSQLHSSQDALDAYAADVFQSGGTESQLGLVFGDGSAQDFADRVIMADTASNVASDTVDRLATIRADNVSTRAYLTAVRGEIAELKRQAEIALKNAEAAAAAATQAKEQAIIARQNAETARANAATAKTSLDKLKSQQSVFANDLQARKADEQADLAAARAESARLNAILVERARQARIAEQKRKARLEAQRQAKIRAEQRKAAEARRKGRSYTPRVPPPVASTSTPSNYLSRPANGPTTSGFGMRWHPILQKWMLHDGLDWGVPCGTPVYAAAPGEVIRAGWRPSGWGNQVVIDHGMHRGVDLVTTYNHLSSIVKWGGQVNRGQLVGYSGTTGYSTGCHLHFGVYEDGTPVNPNTWL